MPSKKILEEKKQTVSKLSDLMKSAHTGVFVDYKGVNVTEDTKLRREIRKAGSLYKVEKNTILRLALKEAGISGLDSILVGTTALALSQKDYVAPAKIVNQFAEEGGKLTIKAGFVDGKAVSVDEIKVLATLPSKKALLSEVLCGLDGPITGFVRVLNGTMKGLVVALDSIAKKEKKSA